MSNPEISRRCRACGASVRARAAFCPQCGRSLGENDAPSASAERFTASPPPPQSEVFTHPRAESRDLEAPEADTAGAQTTSATEANASNASAQKGNAALKRSDAARATHKPNFVTEDKGRRGRGERLHETSVSALDEAAADPGLRFVLVAFVLFILFLLLLLLNSFVG